jgi:iron complex transport system permease protein
VNGLPGRILRVSGILLLVLAAAALFGLTAGPAAGMAEAFAALLGFGENETLRRIVWRLRMPRVAAAGLVGGALSMGGLAFQALLRNPLAEPYILGLSGGAGVGAVLAIGMGLARFPGVCLAAFGGAMAVLVLVLAVVPDAGRATGGAFRERLLLSGVMVNAFCGAVILALVALTSDERLHAVLFWLMGDLSGMDGRSAWILAGLVLPFSAAVVLLAHPMNLLLLGRETAQTSGISVGRVSLLLMTLTSMLVGATVAFCGLIGFVGLVVPHLLRLMFGPDHRVLAPAALLGGGAFLVVCDTLARTLPENGEMPTGVVTALVGAPLFIYFLRRNAP